MFGEKAQELVREACRAQDTLGPFNEDKVRSVLEEMRSLFDENQREVSERGVISPAVHLRHAAIERNKRAVIAYIMHRAERIQSMRWHFGAVLPSEIKTHLCEPEMDFFAKYNRDLAGYMRSLGDGVGLDLLTDMHPPKSLFVEVRCLQDHGEMETDDGEVILLKRNTQYFLPRALCEPLIRQGVLEHVPN